MGRATDALRSRWLGWSAATRLVCVNVVIFISLHLIGVIALLTGNNSVETSLLHVIELPGNVAVLLTHPWTIITYMFCQYDLFHLLFNMLWLYLFGVCFLDIYSGQRLLWLYICGGLSGALFFMIGAVLWNKIALTSALIGASAPVFAIATATALATPNRSIGFILIGPVKLKWIALIMIGIDLLNMTVGNAGGHLAHLGGIIAGIAYWGYTHIKVKQYLRKRYRKNFQCNDNKTQIEIDALLDKIRQSGYSSLSPSERNMLFKLSEKIKNS